MKVEVKRRDGDFTGLKDFYRVQSGDSILACYPKLSDAKKYIKINNFEWDNKVLDSKY